VDHKLIWIISTIESAVDGYNIEFNITKGNSNSFYPVSISYNSEKTISNLVIEKVSLDNDDSISFSNESILETLNCKIE
jgi:hypothetical protein